MIRSLVMLFAVLPCAAAEKGPALWPQFRGVGGQGVAADEARYPANLDPKKNLLWKLALPEGLSSPCIWGNHLFLTAHVKDRKQLETICIDRTRGTIKWRRTAPASEIERTHNISSPAVPTPATDGQHVYVYFGSFGLLAYDFDGKEIWKVPLPTPGMRFGTASSPIVAG